MIKSWNAGQNNDLSSRMSLQMVHESALCVNGVRKRQNMCHQGFELLNGLSFICSDKEIHQLLNQHTVDESIQMQINLGKLRQANDHYKGDLLAIDPHNIIAYSQREMVMKKDRPTNPSQKVLQTFFCIDSQTGQPLCCMLGSSGQVITNATIDLLKMVNMIINQPTLLLADTGHFTSNFLSFVKHEELFEIIMPAPNTQKVYTILKEMDYERKWAGYAVGDKDYFFDNNKDRFYLLGQRSGEVCRDYKYKGFISTSKEDYLKMISQDYPERWTIEEFFNFESAMGWNRASTLNLNVRYGKMSLALIAQAASYQFRKKLPKPYRQWTADTLADSIFRGIDGDIKVVDDTIIVTFYNAPEMYNLRNNYVNLPQKLSHEGINPKIPWLFDFKLDFRFK